MCDFNAAGTRYLLDHCADDLAFFNKMIDKTVLARVKAVAESAFARCSYTEAIEILEVEAKKRKGKKKFVNEVYVLPRVLHSTPPHPSLSP